MKRERSLDSSSDKASIRAASLLRRNALPVALRRELSKTIIDRVTALDEFREAQSILAYASFGSEIDTAPLLQAIIESGKTLLLPRVNKGALDVHAVKSLDDDLRAGLWGIREPIPESCVACSAVDVDLIIVPGVAFDLAGGRIGYGQGYYDKLLASTGSQTIAAAFEVQLVDTIPMEPHDVRVRRIVTESRVVRI